MMILGIDQSLTNLGVVTLTGVAPPVFESICFKTKKMGVERLLIEIPGIISPLLDLRPDLLVLEGGALSSPYMVYTLGELSGVIRYAAHLRGIQTLVVAPATAKAFAVGKGNCSKFEMVLGIQAQFGAQIANEHVADAFWLAMVGAAYFDFPDFPWNEKRTKAINRLRSYVGGSKTREKTKAKLNRISGGSL